MKPVDQSVTASGSGDCLAACVASILEVPVDEVPVVHVSGELWRLQEYLGRHGLAAVWIEVTGEMTIGDLLFTTKPGVLVVAIGGSPRRDCVRHAVVAEIKDFSLQLVHDPHPDRTGLKGEPLSVILLCAVPVRQLPDAKLQQEVDDAMTSYRIQHSN